MKRNALWKPWTGCGLEHLSLATEGASVVADGVVIGADSSELFRVRYRVHCDAQWRVRELDARSLLNDGDIIRLLADGKGSWTTPEGETITALDGCVDVDISVTPFTNTLPIRRLALKPGAFEEIQVAYINVPEMTVEPARQRYTYLERGFDGALYRYESLDGHFVSFTAELPVDADGLVLDYPGLFKRVNP